MGRHPTFKLVAIAVLGALTASGQYPKRFTERITITGAGFRGEIEGRGDPERFSPSGGPGFSSNGVPPDTGWIVDDWRIQVPEPSAGLARYQVVFHVTAYKGWANERHERYAAYYVYDPLAKRGYVRLPKKGEALYEENSRMISRGEAFEGHWFAAKPDWTEAVQAVLSQGPR